MRHPVEREIELGFRPDLGAMLRPMQRGRWDPCLRFTGDAVWRTSVTPCGPATQQLVVEPRGARARVIARSWGPGAAWLAEVAADLVGAADDPSGFPVARDPDGARSAAAPVSAVDTVLDLYARRSATWRVPKGHNVWESAVAAVLEQQVTGLEAKRAWAGLARGYGTSAPGPVPAGMLVFPAASALRKVPTWTWRRLGVDRSRSDTIMRLARVPHVLERLPALALAEAHRRLTSVVGVGQWTYAEVAQRALGDPDAVSVGDFHLAGDVVYALTGRFDGGDDEMLRLLEPFVGHRYRAVRMIELAGIHKPRRGPRMAVPAHRYG